MTSVEWNREDVVTVDDTVVDRIVANAEREPLRRARLCLHRSVDDPVHEMIIALCRDTEIVPHRHPGRCESLHVIRGALTVLLFDDAGEVTERVELAAPGGSLPFAYRLERGRWHSVQVEGEVAVIHEVIQGPFVPAGTETAPWGMAEAEGKTAR